jgi:hypothetical protein
MVFFQDGTPRQDGGIQRIEAPDEEKRTLGTQPAPRLKLKMRIRTPIISTIGMYLMMYLFKSGSSSGQTHLTF